MVYSTSEYNLETRDYTSETYDRKESIDREGMCPEAGLLEEILKTTSKGWTKKMITESF